MMKRVISKRFLPLALAIIMVAALIPGSAFAAEGDEYKFSFDVSTSTGNYGTEATDDDPEGELYWPSTAASITDATHYLDKEKTTYSKSKTGFNPVYDYEYGNYNKYYLFQNRNSKGLCWPNNSSKIVFKVKVPKGTYQIDRTYLINTSYSGDVAIYIDGQYAGAEYTPGFQSDTKLQEITQHTTQLNTLNITPDENGFVEIAFCPIGRYYVSNCNVRIYPLETVFSEVASLSISDIEYTAPPAELAVGATTDLITAKVKVSDGTAESYRFFHTHNGAQEIDAENGVFVTSSDDTVVSVSERTIKDTDTSFSLTAHKPGEATITVTAKVEGTEDMVETFTVTVPGETTEEPDIVSGEVSFGAYSEFEDLVTVTIDGKDSDDVINSVAVGSTVKAVADTNDPNYKFLGWKRGSKDNGVWLTTDETVQFPIMTNTFLTAVYEPIADEATINVEFYNYNGQYLDTAENVGEKKFSEIEAPEATLTGYSNPFWTLDGVNAIDDNETFQKLTRVVANYREKASFAVTIDSTTIEGAGGDTYYDTELELESVSGNAGTWYVNDKPVAYGTSYKHCVWDVASITFEEEETTAPIISIDDTVKENGARMISYDANGKNIVEVGILFGENASLASCSSKAASKAKGDVQGQFTAKPYNSTDTAAKGYLIYEDGGSYKVIYAD